MSKRMNRIGLMLGVAVLSAGATASAAVYTTSFEASEGYSLGNLVSQNAWSAPFGAYTATVIQASSDGLVAPNGTQVARLAMTSATHDARVSHIIDSVAPSSDFTVTAWMAYDDPTDNGTQSVLYIGPTDSSFNGVIFGFSSDGTTGAHFQYRNSNTWTNVANAPLPAEKTFYKFVATVHPSTNKYDLSIFDTQGNAVGDAVTGASARSGNGVYNYLNFSVTSDASNTVGETLWADMAPVPEPGALMLVGLGGLALIRQRR